jgi:serine/threonine protein kinase
MNLVDLALARPAGERESFVRGACSGNEDLVTQVLDYVRWEEQMRGFLTRPFATRAESERYFEAGEVLAGRFRIVREIAQGGMGIVYEAVDQKLNRRIALKCARSGFITYLTPEARHAGEISHPNVCRTFEIHTAATSQNEVEFLTMEFVEGETLTARLRAGPLAKHEALAIARGLASGLAEAHRNQVVHGDLKSNNVILGRTPAGDLRPVITDFGLARHRAGCDGEAFSSGNRAGGTPGYMAPELLLGGKPSPASDVYAIGVILREIAARVEPESSPLKWDQIIDRCLEQQPELRYPGGAELADALAPKPVFRWWMAIAAAVIIAAISGITAYTRAPGPRESIRLALMPVEAPPQLSATAAQITVGAENLMKQLKSGPKARLLVIPASEITRRNVHSPADAARALRASHLARATLSPDSGGFVMHVTLTDAHTLANNADTEFRYAPSETRYAAPALTGIVTAALRVPPIPSRQVNPAVRRDFSEGLAASRMNSTLDRAFPLLERAVASDPDSPLTWAGLAQAQWLRYYATKDEVWLKRAEQSLFEAQRRNPDIALAHLVAGRLAANTGQYERAETEYLRSIDLNPRNADAHRLLGRTYWTAGRLDDARAKLLAAIEVEPQDFIACQDLGGFYQGQGELKAAVQQFETCRELAPNNPVIHLILANVYIDVGRYAEAEREARVALSIAESPDALLRLGLALTRQGRSREAVPYLRKAAGLSPERSLLWMDLGNAYLYAGSLRDARNAYRIGMAKAEAEIEKNPRDANVGFYLAYMCARLGDRRRAETEIARALQLSPESPDIHEGAVWTYETLGERDQTLAVIRRSGVYIFEFVRRLPELADLREDSRFQNLMAAHKKELEENNVR